MAVNVDQMITEVVPEPEPASADAEKIKDWEMIERTCQAHSRWLRDHYRTAAEGFDD